MGSALLFSIVVHAAVLFLFSLATWHLRNAVPSELNVPLLARIVTARTTEDREKPEAGSRLPVTHPASEERPGAVITRIAPAGEIPVVEQEISQTMPDHAEQATGKSESGPPFGVLVEEILFMQPLPRRFTDSNPLLEGQGYIRDVDLDDRAQPLVLAYPEYPPAALAGWIEGWVTIALFIDEKGNVVHAWPVEASEEFQPHELDLMQALRQSTFKPGMLKGKPVKSITFQKLRFDPRGWPNPSGTQASDAPNDGR